MLGPTAILVVIGNEVLSAKVQDENGPWAAARLRDLGVRLDAILTMPDRLDDVVDAVDRARRRATWVFTSGGVGPTHDDVTVPAVARALGRRLVRSGPLSRVHPRHAPPPPRRHRGARGGAADGGRAGGDAAPRRSVVPDARRRERRDAARRAAVLPLAVRPDRAPARGRAVPARLRLPVARRGRDRAGARRASRRLTRRWRSAATRASTTRTTASR